MTLSRSQKDVLDNRKNNNQISEYGFGTVNARVFAECISSIKKAFPRLSQHWYDVLERMLDDEGFTDQRLIDATKAMIKTCEFPEPMVSRILSYDRLIKVYTYNELLATTNLSSAVERKEILGSYERINFHGLLRYAKSDDVKRLNLPTWSSDGKH